MASAHLSRSALAQMQFLEYLRTMNSVILKAHFDGKKICLDDPYPLQPDTQLLVTVVSGDSKDAERRAWLAASQASLARAYADDEPDYTGAALREKPPGK
jgi:hypothetical protein